MNVVNLKPILFPLIIYLLPFIEFIKNNINEADIVLVKSFFFLIFVTFILLLIFAYIINFFFKNTKFSKIFLIVTFIYWLFFKHNLLNLTIKPFLDQFIMNEANFSSELSLFILIILSIYASILIYKENIFFKKFIFIFISLSLFISLFQIISFDHNSNVAKSKNINTINFPDKLNNKKENIYFFILDAMQPINEFKKYYKINNEDFLNYVKSNDYQYIFNTVNTYNNTTHSLSALFYLDEIFDEEEKLKKDAKVLYPSILRLNNKPILIKNLDKLGYNFKWIGNLFADCPKFNLNYCLNKDQNKIVDTYLYINFFRQTPLIQTIMTLGQVFNFDFDKHFYYKLNNGIGRLTNYLRENYQSEDKPTFYFIHHMSPHWPYINNPDCSYKRYPGNKNYEGYKSAYLCNLKRIKETIKFLNDFDPNATVVFQSDHNWPMSRNIKERKMIFNLLKINKDCHLNTNVSWNNVNTLRLIFSCMTGNNPKYIDN
jgi:hypothetical protein